MTQQLLIVMPDKGLKVRDDQLEEMARRLLGVAEPGEAGKLWRKLPALGSKDRSKQIEDAMPFLIELLKGIFSMQLPSDVALPDTLIPNLCLLRVGDARLKTYSSSKGVGMFDPGIAYAAHPKRPNYYVRLAEFHRRLPNEKRAEFSRLVSSLGAQSLWLKGSQDIKKVAEGKVKTEMGISGGPTAEVSGRVASSRSSDFTLAQTWGFSAIEPYFPGDLVWYDSEPHWRTIVDARMGGKWLESYEITFEYTSDFGITSEINALIEGIGISTGGTFTRFEETVEEYRVDFYGRDAYKHLYVADSSPVIQVSAPVLAQPANVLAPALSEAKVKRTFRSYTPFIVLAALFVGLVVFGMLIGLTPGSGRFFQWIIFVSMVVVVCGGLWLRKRV